MLLSNEIIREAINSINRIQDVINRIEEDEKVREKFGSSFRTRTREFPEMMEVLGIIPALTFMYAKAESKSYKELCRVLDDEKAKLSEKLDRTNFGYAAYLHEILSYTERNLLSGLNHRDPILSFEKIRENIMIIKPMLRSYLIELKKLAEAVFKPEEG